MDSSKDSEKKSSKHGMHVCKAKDYARRRKECEDSELTKEVVLGVEAAFLTGPLPQGNDPNFTGLWEDSTRAVSVAVNHAGNYVSLWASQFGEPQAYHYLGKGVTPNFQIYDAEDTSKYVGVLGLGEDGKSLVLDLREVGWEHVWQLSRIDHKPRMSQRALSMIPDDEVQELLRRVELAPPRRTHLRAIEEIITGEEMQGLLSEFYSKAVTTGGAYHLQVATKINAHLEKMLGDMLDWTVVIKPGELYKPHKNASLFRQHVRGVINAKYFTHRVPDGWVNKVLGSAGDLVTRPLADWFADIRAVLEDESLMSSTKLPAIRSEILGLTDPPDERRYQYEIEVKVKGMAGDIGIGASLFSGDFLVWPLQPERPVEPWRYHVAFASGSAGPSAGLRFYAKARGTGFAPRPWSRRDFIGLINTYETSTNAAVGAGFSTGSTTWRLHGPGHHRPMEVVLGTADTVGLELGAEHGMGVGTIHEERRSLRRALRVPKWKDYSVRYHANTDAHFELGKALIRSEGWDIIGWMCAEELTAMRNKQSKLRLIGSADRVDRRWFNEALSTARAQNVAQAIRDTVGPTLAAEFDVKGYGEGIPELLQTPDNVEDPQWRRVFVELAGKSLTTLRGVES